LWRYRPGDTRTADLPVMLQLGTRLGFNQAVVSKLLHANVSSSKLADSGKSQAQKTCWELFPHSLCPFVKGLLHSVYARGDFHPISLSAWVYQRGLLLAADEALPENP
jgi:hypothetical protein